MIKQVGFYRELVGNELLAGSAPSLREAARPVGEWDEERILGYLESGTEIYTTMGAGRDVISDDEWIPGAGSLVTDGTWLWLAELAHYVRRHHIALPSEFVNHIRAQGYSSSPPSSQRVIEILNEHFGKEVVDAARAEVPKNPGFFTWYFPSLSPLSSSELIKHLATAGLSAVYPLTDSLDGFRQTSEGAQEPLLGAVDTLVSTLANDHYRHVEFHCYMGYDQALTAVVRRVDDATQKATFRLSDIPESDREEVVAALVRTLDQDAAHCLGFVIDRTGTSGAQDWDRILLGPGEPVATWPDTLGILRNRVSTHPELVDEESTEYGPLAVFHRPKR